MEPSVRSQLSQNSPLLIWHVSLCCLGQRTTTPPPSEGHHASVPAVSAVTELAPTPGAPRVHRGCRVPSLPLGPQQCEQQYLCVHLLAPGAAGKSLAGGCPSASHSPRLCRTPCGTRPAVTRLNMRHTKHTMGTMALHSPLSCQGFPSASRPMLTYRRYMKST